MADQLGEPDLFILLDEWRDKFDCNQSKANRTNAIATTTSFAGADKSSDTSILDTYVQCVGNGSDNSQVADRDLANQTRNLVDRMHQLYSPHCRDVVN